MTLLWFCVNVYSISVCVYLKIFLCGCIICFKKKIYINELFVMSKCWLKKLSLRCAFESLAFMFVI